MQEIFAKLGVDWKILLTQLINFAILLFVLKKFLYRPILGMLEKRREKIEKSLKEAEAIEKKFVEIKQEREGILKKANLKAEEILKESKNMAKEREAEILAQAQNEARGLFEEEKKKMLQEKEKLMTEARQDLAELVVLATEKMVKEKLNQEKEKELAEEVIAKL